MHFITFDIDAQQFRSNRVATLFNDDRYEDDLVDVPDGDMLAECDDTLITVSDGVLPTTCFEAQGDGGCANLTDETGHVWRDPEAKAAWDAKQSSPMLGLPLNDYGNATRFIRLHGEQLKHVRAMDQWLKWDGRRWAAVQSDGELHLLAGEVGDELAAAANGAALTGSGTTNDVRRMRDWARSSGDYGHLKAMVELAAQKPEVLIEAARVDEDPNLLVVENGVLNMISGELRPHDRAPVLSKMVPIEYDPVAATPRWQQQLELITGGDIAFIEYLQRACGYSISGETSEKVMFFMFGPRDSGKSTFSDVLERLAGEHFTKTRVDTFISKRGDGGIPNDLAALAGYRLVTATENDGRRWNTGLIKDVTGGDMINARFLHQEYFSFRPKFKLWCYGNTRPNLGGVDEASLQRLHILPFAHTITSPRPRAGVMAELMPELPGILAWAVRGYQQYRRQGLNPPPTVVNASREFRDENDTVAEFLQARTVNLPGQKTKFMEVHQEYARWIESRNEMPLGYKRFNEELRKRGKRGESGTGHVYWWHDLVLLRPATFTAIRYHEI